MYITNAVVYARSIFLAKTRENIYTKLESDFSKMDVGTVSIKFIDRPYEATFDGFQPALEKIYYGSIRMDFPGG